MTLADNGYAIVPGYLDAGEIAALVDEFHTVSATETLNPNFDGLRFMSGPIRHRFAPKLLATGHEHGSTMDRIRVGLFYSSRLGNEFLWHTDTSSTYAHGRFLNFWIPLVKPDRARSGLGVIDTATFAARRPDLAAEIAGRGAIRAKVVADKTVFFDSNRLGYLEVDDPHLLDELAVYPEIGPGDLLMLRNDTFHRTQDTKTDRLAVSFRAIDTTAIVTREALQDMGSAKFNNMARMREQFARWFAAFDIAKRDQLTIREYEAIYVALEARELDACLRLGVEALTNAQLEDLIDELS